MLVIGERGTGKELIAERLHQLSRRWAEPLITLNCAALPETLIEAELFGHEAGAFTGATRARAGRFEEADKGTLFLDELATLSMGAQERLLRAVEYGEVTRIGSSRADAVDVRIVAATNEDLPQPGRGGPVPRRPARPAELRSDHSAAAAGARGRHPGAVPTISVAGWRRSSAGNNGPGFTRPPPRALEDHQWPGNVRELRNVIERAVYRWDDWDEPVGHIVFDPFDSPWKPVAAPRAASGRHRRALSPRSAVARRCARHRDRPAKAQSMPTRKRSSKQALARHRYNQRQTAKALGLSYDQLRHAMKKHGLGERP